MGFGIVRQNLFMSVVLDLVKITIDNQGPRIPSLANLMNTLADVNLVAFLRSQQVDQQYLEPLKELTGAENAERVQRQKDEVAHRFDEHLAQLNQRWPELRDCPELARFKTVRDRYLAHLDLGLDSKTGEYRMLDLKKIGLKWGDAGRVIGLARDVIDDLNHVVRGAGFNWEGFERQNQATASGFWRS
jgi:hypothetical protein